MKFFNVYIAFKMDNSSTQNLPENMKTIEKIKFPNISKLKHPIALKINVQSKTFQNKSYEDDEKKTRLETIDYYYQNIETIHKSMMKTGNKGGYKTAVISTLYETIFGTQKNKGKRPKKNDMITQILDYYKNSYVPRVGATASNTYIDMDDNKNQEREPSVFSGYSNNGNNRNNEDDSDSDYELGDF